MIEKIIPDRMSLTLPTVFGEELTFLEFCGKVREKLNECIDAINEGTATIEEMSATFAEWSTEFGKYNEKFATIDSNIASILATVNQCVEDINSGKATMESFSYTLGDCVSRLDSAEADITSLTSRVGKTEGDVSDLATIVSDAEGDISSLSSRANIADQNISSLSSRVGTAEGNITSLSSRVETAEGNITSLSAKDTAIEEEIATISGNVEANRNANLLINCKNLFAPVILEVNPHTGSDDITFSAFVRIGRVSIQGTGCPYAKVNFTFSGAIGSKKLQIDSVQFGVRTVIGLDSTNTTFSAKTDVINLPIKFVGTDDIPIGTTDISVVGANLFNESGSLILNNAIRLSDLPTGKEILCDSIIFSSPGGNEQNVKCVYSFEAREGSISILSTAAGIPAISARASVETDFSSVIGNTEKIYAQFLCSGGSYDSSNISTISDSGASLGVALVNYLEYGQSDGSVMTARIKYETINPTGNSLKKTGNTAYLIPFGNFLNLSLKFDLII